MISSRDDKSCDTLRLLFLSCACIYVFRSRGHRHDSHLPLFWARQHIHFLAQIPKTVTYARPPTKSNWTSPGKIKITRLAANIFSLHHLSLSRHAKTTLTVRAIPLPLRLPGNHPVPISFPRSFPTLSVLTYYPPPAPRPRRVHLPFQLSKGEGGRLGHSSRIEHPRLRERH